MSKSTVSPTRNYPGGLTRHDVVAWRNATFTIFGLCGIGLASWIARVPAVRDALGASTLQMGMLIFGLAAGSILGLLASGQIIARFGAARTIAWCLTIGPVGFAFAGVFATVGPSFAAVLIGLAIFGAAFSVTDVSMNVSGAANERVSGRSIMPIFHACFSFGTMLGAGGGALAEWAGLPIAIHTAIIAAVMIAGAHVAVRFLQSENLVAEEASAEADPSTVRRGRLDIWREPRTLLIGLIVLGMAFAEGSANDWLALAMVDGHGVDNATGAIVLGVFVTAMTVGRLLGVLVLDRYGRVPVLRASAGLATLGLLIMIFVPNAWIATVGVVLWGLGSALGFPVGMSAAADDPKTAAARVSAVATIGYCAFLVGPPLIGFLGEHIGLLNGLLVVLVLVALAGAVSHAAREPGATASAAPVEPAVE
ncbi:MFS transporter [Parafrigoribacterium mesophilum]|uniref:MFS transporter n=1 Tax=Parafrigoribacterium mesophilum TaxID=433646 RepID=UPI0031FCECD4